MKKQFLSYALIGCLNTAIHWGIFAVAFWGLHWQQALSNLSGFIVAVTFSFVANLKITFKSQGSVLRFFSFSTFMACLSWLIGYISDTMQLSPLFTLVTFSGVSLVLGFLFSKYIVFK